MAYQEFTLETVRTNLGLTVDSNQDLFSAGIPSISLTESFTESLSYSVPLALVINTEKARSEMIIAPILITLRRLLDDRVSLFSGTGNQWKFLRLQGDTACIDCRDYHVDQIEAIMGILVSRLYRK